MKKNTYLFKIDQKLVALSDEDIAAMPNNLIYNLTIDALKEQRKQLLIDAKKKKQKLFKNKIVVDELENTLKKLDERIPKITQNTRNTIFGQAN